MDNMFNNVDFGPIKKYLDDDDITDVSYSNNGQLWLKSLSKGIYKPETQDVNNAVIEKLAFQCANMMGKTFNMAHPFLDAESAELRLNFVHDSIAKNGIALLMRKTPAKIRLSKEKILDEKYIIESIHDFLIKCIEGHCNIIISGETGSGKTEFLKYLASHTKENEKLITIEDTLELHLDKIFPNRDIVAMKTNNIASYSDVLVTCMRQNPKWILLSEVRSAEAVMAVRNCISSGHYILSTIHADKAESIPSRMYSLLESDLDYDQYLKTIHRYVQLGVHIRGYQDKTTQKFVREVCEVCEFYVDENNNPGSNIIYRKSPTGQITTHNPTKHLLSYLEAQGIIMDPNFIENSGLEKEASSDENVEKNIKLEAQSVVEQPKPVVEASKPNVLDSQPVQKVLEQPKPVMEAPKPNVLGSQPVQPVVEQPKPVVEAPKPNVLGSQPVQKVVEQPKPVVEAPKPNVLGSQPVQPVLEQPKPVMEAPKPNVLGSQPVQPVQPVVEQPQNQANNQIIPNIPTIPIINTGIVPEPMNVNNLANTPSNN